MFRAQTKAKTQRQLRRAAATKQDASETTPAKLGVDDAPGGGAAAAAAPPGGGCGAVAVVRRALAIRQSRARGSGAPATTGCRGGATAAARQRGGRDRHGCGGRAVAAVEFFRAA